MKLPIKESYGGDNMEDAEYESDLGSEDDYNEEENVEKTSNGAKKRGKPMEHKGSAKKTKLSKYTKQPTTEELNRLRETETLFNSNFLRLQIEEVLKEVTVKPKYITQFNKWLSEFNSFIDNLKDEMSTYDINDRSWLQGIGICFPLVEEPKETKGHFKFLKCAPARVIGSHGFGASLGPSLSVDVKLEMPREMINKNDYLNERYLRKRALYLCHIAKELRGSGLVEDMRWRSIDGSNTRPVLELTPTRKTGRHVNVTLHVGVAGDVMKMSRFGPFRSNVRGGWRLGGEGEGPEREGAGPEDDTPTPRYNASVLCDLVEEANHALLTECIGEKTNVQQGVLLLKIWLAQRGLRQFSGHIMSLYVAHLVKTKRINNSMSSYQVVRNVWTALSSSEWDTRGLTLFPSSPPSFPSLPEFLAYHPVVLVDCTGHHNVCYHLSLHTYQQTRAEASLALTYLDSHHANGFAALFMTPVNFYMKYDHVLRLENSPQLVETMKKLIDKTDILDCGADLYSTIERYLLDVLQKGLGDRVTCLAPQGPTEEDLRWDSNESPLDRQYNRPYIIGIKLNPEQAFRTVDKGPQANLPEAEEFRKFWGNKSELRRFQDGSISEACVWESKPTAQSRRTMVKQIVTYLLREKLGIGEKMVYVCDEVEFVLQNCKRPPEKFSYGTGEEASAQVLQACDGLMKALRSLVDVPLEIHSIQGISPVFSYCEVAPPLPYAPPDTGGFPHREGHRLIRDQETKRTKSSQRTQLAAPLYVPENTLIIQLSQSGKWPHTLEAFRAIKTAFYIQISHSLRQQHDSIVCHVLGDHLRVLWAGYVFRVEVGHPREVQMLREGGAEGIQATALHQRIVLLPRVRIALNGLHMQHPSYGPSTCLLKRWLRSHLIDHHHLPDLPIDLIMAHIFLQPAPYQVASQSQANLWRALRLLGHTDWSTQMLVVNFNDDLSRDELLEMESRFASDRDSPAPPLHCDPLRVWQ